MGMKLKEFLKAAEQIEECDKLIGYWSKNPILHNGVVSREMKEVLVFAVQQRKANLIDKLKNYGVEVEV